MDMNFQLIFYYKSIIIMKIKVERTDNNNIVRLQFNADKPDVSGTNPYMYEEELKVLLKNRYGVTSDLNYTIRRMGDKLIVWYDEDCKVVVHMDISKFINAIMKLPIGKEVIMDTDSFNKQRIIDDPNKKSWVEIGKWVKPDCIKTILNAKKRGLHTELKPLLSRYVGSAEIYPDHDRLNLSFYFNGRYEGGCGYNGGIICHNAGEETFSVELTSKPGEHYSIHT